MVDQSCSERFTDFKRDRNEDAHLGRDDFPATSNHCNIIPKPKPSIGDGGRDDATPASSFAQFEAKDGSEPVVGKDGGIFPHIKCRNCDKYGHYKGACPKKRKTKRMKNENDDDDTDKDEDEKEEALSAFGWVEDSEEIDPGQEYGGENGHLNAFTFGDCSSDGSCFSATVRYKGKISGRLLILLDTGATRHLFCNGALLQFIKAAKWSKVIVTNAGRMNVDEEGVFPDIGNVYYHPDAVINVLSLGMIESRPEKFRVKHVSGNHFLVTDKKTNKSMRFRLRNGFYVTEIDTAALYGSVGKNISNNISAYVLATIETVAKNELAHTAPLEMLHEPKLSFR